MFLILQSKPPHEEFEDMRWRFKRSLKTLQLGKFCPKFKDQFERRTHSKRWRKSQKQHLGLKPLARRVPQTRLCVLLPRARHVRLKKNTIFCRIFYAGLEKSLDSQPKLSWIIFYKYKSFYSQILIYKLEVQEKGKRYEHQEGVSLQPLFLKYVLFLL